MNGPAFEDWKIPLGMLDVSVRVLNDNPQGSRIVEMNVTCSKCKATKTLARDAQLRSVAEVSQRLLRYLNYLGWHVDVPFPYRKLICPDHEGIALAPTDRKLRRAKEKPRKNI